VTPGVTGEGLRHERRFLLPAVPRALAAGTASLVEERYLAGTRLALRRAVSPVAPARPELTLSQRIRGDPAARVTLTERLRPDAYAALCRLPAEVLVWRRYPVRLAGWPCAVDVFAGDLSGLVLAQAAFSSAAELARFPAPVYAVAEVTGDQRFTEEELARISAAELARAVSEYGMLLR
jgi:CYTH domain-containing protein